MQARMEVLCVCVCVLLCVCAFVCVFTCVYVPGPTCTSRPVSSAMFSRHRIDDATLLWCAPVNSWCNNRKMAYRPPHDTKREAATRPVSAEPPPLPDANCISHTQTHTHPHMCTNNYAQHALCTPMPTFNVQASGSNVWA